MAGHTQRAEQLLAELTRISPRQHVPQMSFAFVHAALGHHDRAFEALDRAYRDHEIALAQIHRWCGWIRSGAIRVSRT